MPAHTPEQASYFPCAFLPVTGLNPLAHVHSIGMQLALNTLLSTSNIKLTKAAPHSSAVRAVNKSVIPDSLALMPIPTLSYRIVTTFYIIALILLNMYICRKYSKNLGHTTGGRLDWSNLTGQPPALILADYFSNRLSSCISSPSLSVNLSMDF